MRSTTNPSFQSPVSSMLIVAAALTMAWAAPAEASYEIELVQGWNLVSLPEQQEVVDIDEVTVSIEGEFRSIWTWVDGAWQVYDPELPEISNLTSMDAGRAYWIDMKQAGTLVGQGFHPASTLELEPGWNMVGFNDDESVAVGELLDETGLCISSIWAYENGSWAYYDRSSPHFSDLDSLEPGRGYWVWANNGCHLSVNLSIPSTTKTVQVSELPLLTEVSPSRVVFSSSTSNLGSVRVGDTLACPPTSRAPTGFLREVTGVSLSGSSLILSTQNGLIEEALEDAVIGSTVSLGPDDVKVEESSRFWLVRGEELEKAARQTGHTNLVKVRFEDQFDEPFNLPTGGEVTFKGSFSFEPRFLVHLELRRWTIEEISCVFTGEAFAEVSIEGSQDLLSYEVDKKAVGSFTFTTIVFWAGYVPVTITPRVTIYVGGDGKVTAQAAVTAQMTAEASAGVAFERGDGWRSISHFGWDFDLVRHEANITADFNVWAGPHLEFLVYDAVGPWIGIHGFGDATASISPPLLEIDIGAEFVWGVTSGKFLEMFGLQFDLPGDPIELIRYQVYPNEGTSFSGRVQTSDGSPLAGVRVVIDAGSDEAPAGLETYTDTSGEYQLEVPPGYYSEIEFSKSGFEVTYLRDQTAAAGRDTSLQLVKMFESGHGSFGGFITDAVTGEPVGGMRITVRPGINNRLGGSVANTVSLWDGSYQVSNLDSGYYTLEVTGDGYQTAYFSAYCIAFASNSNQNGTVTPFLESQDLRIVLSWGSDPWDLDSHLTGPIPGSSNRFHIYYANRGSLDSSPYAYLDRDDMDQYGPETTTITQVFDGMYRYSVHDFSNLSSSSSTALSDSSAHVDVYRGSSLWKRYDVPSRPGTLWTVFEYENGQIREIGTMSYQSSPSGVQKAGPTDADLIRSLPAKEVP